MILFCYFIIITSTVNIINTITNIIITIITIIVIITVFIILFLLLLLSFYFNVFLVHGSIQPEKSVFGRFLTLQCCEFKE